MRSRHIRLSVPIILLILAVAAYAVYFSHLTLTRYAAFEARALDMGNLNQAIWNTAQGNWFHLTNQPGTVNRLSLHVEPILIPISWLYWIYSGPPTLLILQALIVALGAIPLYALARTKQFNPWAALAFAAAFLLNPSIQAANWLEFHPVTLAPTFLIAAFYFLVTGRTGWFALFAVLAASCKEEIALLIFMLGLYAVIALRRPRLGIVTMILSALWAFTAVFLIQNAFADGNIHWNRYAYLGDTPPEMVTSLLTQPGAVIDQLRSASAMRYLFQILLPLAFMPLLALDILVLALPSFALNLLADFAPMHQVYTLIYAAPIIPFAMIGSVYGAHRLANWSARIRQGQYAQWRATVAAVAAACVFGFALASSFLYGYIPGGANHILFTVTDHDRRAAGIIAQIPADAKVSAHDRLDPHVSGRETIYIFPRIEDADTIFVDVIGPAWPQHPSDLRTSIEELLAQDFGVAAADDGYLLLRRGLEGATIPDEFYSAWQRPGHVPVNPVQVDFGDALRLVDHQVRTDDYGETVVDLYWQTLRPLDEDYGFYIAYRNRDGDTLYDTRYYPPASVLWYPTSQWEHGADSGVEPGATTLVQTLPWALDADLFSLMLGVYSEENGGVSGGRLPVVNSAPALPVLENGSLVRLGGFERSKSGGWQPLEFTTGEVPAGPQRPIQAQFGDAIALDGVTLPATALSPGDELPFTLFWRAADKPDMDYTAFVHLLDADGNKVAQHDWQPRDEAGPRPATTWREAESLVDAESLSIPANLAPGNYRMIVGMYNWQNGERLPVQGPDANSAEVVTVGEIEIQ